MPLFEKRRDSTNVRWINRKSIRLSTINSTFVGVCTLCIKMQDDLVNLPQGWRHPYWDHSINLFHFRCAMTSCPLTSCQFRPATRDLMNRFRVITMNHLLWWNENGNVKKRGMEMLEWKHKKMETHGERKRKNSRYENEKENKGWEHQKEK